MQSLLRQRLGLHRSYLIVIIYNIKDNDAISTATATGAASLIFDCDYCNINDNDAIYTATAIGDLSSIFDL